VITFDPFVSRNICRWTDTPSQGTTPVSQRGSMPRASASQISFVDESGTRCVAHSSMVRFCMSVINGTLSGYLHAPQWATCMCSLSNVCQDQLSCLSRPDQAKHLMPPHSSGPLSPGAARPAQPSASRLPTAAGPLVPVVQQTWHRMSE
jgi:hypothetical protein